MPEDKVFLTRSLSMNQEPAGALVGIRGIWLGAIIRMQDEEEIIIGRDAGVANLVFAEKTISRKHCSIVYHGSTGLYTVTDWSMNGTFRGDGSRLSKGRAYNFPSGAELLIGSAENVFKLG